MDLFTLFHVALSLVGIGSGAVVLIGLLRAQRLEGWTKLFLATTLATSITGFLFPIHGITPGLIFGAISVVLLSLAIVARYVRGLAGSWRRVFVVTSMVSFYLNVFVLVVQMFQKVPALQALAPTQSEAPFAAAQLLVLVGFLVLGIRADKSFRPLAPRPA